MPSSSPRVIVASADAFTLHALSDTLEREGFQCVQARSAQECKEKQTDAPSAVLWDSATLGEKAPEEACMLERPARLSILSSQLRALSSALNTSPLALAEGWSLNAADRALVKEQERIPLTEKETSLLLCLLSAPGRAEAREQLLSEVWGYAADADTHTLETHIHRLRSRLKEALGEGEWIRATAEGYEICL